MVTMTLVVRVAALIRINLSNCMFGGGICDICSICGVGSGSGGGNILVVGLLSLSHHHHHYQYYQHNHNHHHHHQGSTN